ncbi:MAG: hypothetical protein Q8J92_12710 [Parvibaculum sp.]|nr:hypothetical protein [Parvibaculum sp.]
MPGEARQKEKQRLWKPDAPAPYRSTSASLRLCVNPFFLPFFAPSREPCSSLLPFSRSGKAAQGESRVPWAAAASGEVKIFAREDAKTRRKRRFLALRAEELFAPQAQ